MNIFLKYTHKFRFNVIENLLVDPSNGAAAASVVVSVPVSGDVQAEMENPPPGRDVEEIQAAIVD